MSETPARRPVVYVVDDDARLAEVIARLLDAAGYRVRTFPTGEELLAACSERPPGLVLLDLVLPGIDGLESLRRLRERLAELPVVMMSGKGTIRAAVDAVKAGAWDFLEKPLDANRLRVTVRNAIEQQRLRQRLARLSEEFEDAQRMVGVSPAMARLRADIERVAGSDVSVLFLGESGVGKEVAARETHRRSARSDERFVALNCAAIPSELIESELFGAERGAYTGADAARSGKLEEADGGTLFLDEVADMGAAAQAKLLRFLDGSEVQRLGSSESRHLDVRVLAATNRDLARLAAAGRFRDDLYHRLNVVSIVIPPLRERREDILPLAGHFLARYARKHKRDGAAIGQAAAERLERYPWPGNVRELRNVIERAVVMAPDLDIVSEDLRLPADEPAGPADDSLRARVALAERQAVADAIERAGGNVARAARMLGVERPSLYRIMRRHGLGGTSEADEP